MACISLDLFSLGFARFLDSMADVFNQPWDVFRHYFSQSFSIPFSLFSKSSVATNVGTSVALQQISRNLFTLFQYIFCFRSSEFQWFIHSLVSGLSTQQVVPSFLQFPFDLCLKFLVFKIFSLDSREIMIESFCESYFKILSDMSYI